MKTIVDIPVHLWYPLLNWGNRCIQVLNWNIKSTTEYNDVSSRDFINPGRYTDISLKNRKLLRNKPQTAIKSHKYKYWLIFRYLRVIDQYNTRWYNEKKNHTLIFVYHFVIKSDGFVALCIKNTLSLKNNNSLIYSQHTYVYIHSFIARVAYLYINYITMWKQLLIEINLSRFVNFH